MIRIIISCLIVSIPTCVAQARTLPTVHETYGLRATASVFRIENDGPRPSGPRAEATGIQATSAVDLPPLIKTNSKAQVRAAHLIQQILPTFVLKDADLPLADRYDAIFFADTKVIRVRLRLKVAEAPLAVEWKARLRAYFNYLDRDRDGYLNAFEADMVFSPRAMQSLLKTGFANPNLSDPGRTLMDLDIDQDGRVSLDELTAYYSPVLKDLVRSQFKNAVPDVVSQRLTDELFKLFDRDKDGKLSRAELQNLEELIPQLDQNEDECLTAIELVPNVYNNNPPRPIAIAALSGNPNTIQPLQVWAAGTIPQSIVDQLFQRYDKDKNLRISKAENPFTEAIFARLDKNGDGELSLTEVLSWRESDPDFKIELTLASKQSDCKVKPQPGSDGKPVPLAITLRIAENGKAFIRVGNQTLDLVSFSPNGMRIGNQFGQVYQQADPQNRGYFTESQLAGPQFQFLRILFDVMDQNLDGRVTRAEFNAYFAIQNSFVDLPVILLHNSRTPSLFQLLDTNGDGRLSVPELRAAWNNLKDLEPSAGEFITRAAIQPHGQLRFGRSATIFNAPEPGATFAVAMQQPKSPLWFRKMDRNNDGVISRSEFPGRSEEFDRLDTNHDNLIDLNEAEAADKLLRTPTAKK